MGRRPTSNTFVTPIDSSGNAVAAAPSADANLINRGVFTLTAGTTYFLPLGGMDAEMVSAHLVYDAAIILTSVTVETCDFPPEMVTDYADGATGTATAGYWIDEDPSTAFVGTRGGTVTNGVLAVAGGAQGGARWNVADNAARRTRLRVVVGATGGEVSCAAWGKE